MISVCLTPGASAQPKTFKKQVTIKLSKTNLVVVGAGVQILIFAANIALLFIYRPYKAGHGSEVIQEPLSLKPGI